MAKIEQTSSDKIEALQLESLAAIENIADLEALEDFRVKWLGRKGILAGVLRGMSEAPPGERPALGKAANALKAALTDSIATKKAALDASGSGDSAEEKIDFSLPGRRPPQGHLHVITQVTDEIVDIFSELGYQEIGRASCRERV